MFQNWYVCLFSYVFLFRITAATPQCNAVRHSHKLAAWGRPCNNPHNEGPQKESYINTATMTNDPSDYFWLQGFPKKEPKLLKKIELLWASDLETHSFSSRLWRSILLLIGSVPPAPPDRSSSDNPAGSRGATWAANGHCLVPFGFLRRLVVDVHHAHKLCFKYIWK